MRVAFEVFFHFPFFEGAALLFVGFRLQLLNRFVLLTDTSARRAFIVAKPRKAPGEFQNNSAAGGAFCCFHGDHRQIPCWERFNVPCVACV